MTRKKLGCSCDGFGGLGGGILKAQPSNIKQIFGLGFFEEIGALSPQPSPDIPRVMEIAKKFGLEILPPTGA